MPEITFWRDLAARFQRLHEEDGNRLGAQWISTEWNESGDQWWLDGGANDTVRGRFQILALRAAVELGHSEESSGLAFWLNLLKRESPFYHENGQSTGYVADGSLVVSKIGSIRVVCRVSSEFCLHCETKQLLRANSAIEKTADVPKISIELLLEEAQAAWMRGVPDQNKALEKDLSALQSRNLPFSGRATNAFRIYRDHLANQVKDRVNAYKAVAEARRSHEMLSEERIDELRERINAYRRTRNPNSQV